MSIPILDKSVFSYNMNPISDKSDNQYEIMLNSQDKHNDKSLTISIHPGVIHIVIIDEKPDDVKYLEQMLCHLENPIYRSRHVPTLEDGIQLHRKAEHPIDVILLGLSLPNGRGLDVLVKICAQIPDKPIIVMTGTDDENMAIQAVRLGAQDYLIKPHITTEMLTRSIRYSIERQILRKKLEESRRNEQKERELRSLGRLSAAAAPITAKTYGQQPLKEQYPDIFKQLQHRYQQILEQSLEDQMYKTDRALSEKIKEIGDQLGFIKAAPRDVIDIHTSTLQQAILRLPSEKALSFVEEGRIVILELMGYLTSYYRHTSFGIRWNDWRPS